MTTPTAPNTTIPPEALLPESERSITLRHYADPTLIIPATLFYDGKRLDIHFSDEQGNLITQVTIEIAPLPSGKHDGLAAVVWPFGQIDWPTMIPLATLAQARNASETTT